MYSTNIAINSLDNISSLMNNLFPNKIRVKCITFFTHDLEL